MSTGLFVGLATLDVLSLVPRLPHPDEKLAPLDQKIVAGGPATNAAVTFSGLGGAARLATVLGRHHVTGLARDELELHGVEILDLDHDPAFHLPLVTILVQDATGERAVISSGSRGFGGRPIDPVPSGVVESADVLLVDGHLMEPSLDAAARARRAGVPVVLDAGSWKEGLEELLPLVDHAVCSQVFRPPGARCERDAIEALAAVGIPEIAVTRGPEPILYRGAGGEASIPPPRVEAVDTLGAGDVFHGAYAHALTRGRSAREALEDAASVAALSCRWFGPRAWIEHVDEGC